MTTKVHCHAYQSAFLSCRCHVVVVVVVAAAAVVSPPLWMAIDTVYVR